MKNDDSYCGFSCGDQLKKIQEVCHEIIVFSKYNPEYSLVMLGKVMEVVYKTRAELIKMEEVDWEKQLEQAKKKKIDKVEPVICKEPE